jgi:hypothetical protein
MRLWKSEKQHCRLVSPSDMFVQQERTKVQLTWDLSVKPLSENSCCDYCGREKSGLREELSVAFGAERLVLLNAHRGVHFPDTIWSFRLADKPETISRSRFKRIVFSRVTSGRCHRIA